MMATVLACLLGFANGVRHAFEPDHLAAVSTLVAGRTTAQSAMRYAFAWGTGHATVLVVVAGALALLRSEVSAEVSDLFELVVSAMLVALGVRGLRQAHAEMRRTDDAGSPRHAHGSHERHLPFFVGLVHGLAGSGALAALVASRIESRWFSLTFIAVYALGAALGMTALAGALGWPLARLARSRFASCAIVGLSASVSLLVGALWAAPIVARFAGT